MLCAQSPTRSLSLCPSSCSFFHAPAPPVLYSLSLHDALPISQVPSPRRRGTHLVAVPRSPAVGQAPRRGRAGELDRRLDRKSTRLNSSHRCISYAVFCLKKKKKNEQSTTAHDDTPP